MREIKFRAWDQHGEMVDESRFYVASNGVPMWTNNNEHAYDLTLMQYTGLHDKNNREIYEGDIIDCTIHFDGRTLPHLGEVVYDDDLCSFATKNHAKGRTPFLNHNINTRRVIGNVYEHSHLLESNK